MGLCIFLVGDTSMSILSNIYLYIYISIYIYIYIYIYWLSSDPDLFRKPSEPQVKQRSVFDKRRMVENNGQGINP